MAARIELALAAEGHSVFRDRTSLPPGESFDARIRAAIDDCDLFVFLVDAESVAPGHYTLTELKFAQQKWAHPAGHVLPVLTDATPIEAIPEYLRAVTILMIEGDVAAEVAAEVARLPGPRRRVLRRPRVAAALAGAALLLGIGLWLAGVSHLERRRSAERIASVVEQARLQAASGNYASAWSTLEQAGERLPPAPALAGAQEQLAMAWLENARGSEAGLTLRQIADTVSPVLARGAAASSGQRAADLTAHLGWADFLRSRDGVGGIQPAAQYERALDLDPGNVFAHAMWGFEITRTGGSPSDGREHFRRALAAGRDRDFVRHLQISALLWSRDPEREHEAVRVANEIRTNGEIMPIGAADRPDAWRLWNVYYDRLINGLDRAAFLAALSPTDHLATFTWLYPEESFPKGKHLYHFALAQFEEAAGHREAALASYRFVLDDAARTRSTGRLVDAAQEAVEALSRSERTPTARP
jgi:tetratricopeptide (TPR) repeat protein